MKNFFVKTALLLLLATSCAEKGSKRYSDSLSPEQALTRFDLDTNFTIEIFASEPFVMDPVELSFDESGRGFVVEMPDYPFRPANGVGRGRIRMITDTDGDGRVDSSVIFADSILEAASVLSWKGGLIVAAAPNIFYMKDTNADNKADTKELLFTGFFRNNPEYQVNNLRFSIDNWIYAANFGQAGMITSGSSEDTVTISVKRGDFRFRPDNGKFEAASGRAQFGHAFDVWGHRFTNDNSTHIAQPVIPWRYIHRHPFLPPFEEIISISDHEQLMFQQTEAQYWRQERTKRRNEAFREQKIDRTEYADDHFTGACGPTLYAGDAFPDEYYGNIFVNDVAGNLVHRDIVDGSADSILFVAKRAGNNQSREFLSSTDPWFRPVNLTVGPDGALYVVDMYRQHVEGPDFIPEDLKKDMDFLNGSDKGRIYRIAPKKNSQVGMKRDLRTSSTAELVQLLSHKNQWWRLQAQKLLIERQDAATAASLKKLFTDSNDPVIRLHALYLLDGLSALNAATVTRAMNDPHPAVRELAMELSERFPQNLGLLKNAVKDSSARVALQASLSLGEFPAKQVLPVFADVIKLRGEDLWFRIAVLSSVPGSSMEFFEMLFRDGYFFNERSTSFLKDFCFVIGRRNEGGEVNSLLEMLESDKLTASVREAARAAVTGGKE